MDTRRQQSDSQPLRELEPEETAVLFFIDAAAPPISDEEFDMFFLLLRVAQGGSSKRKGFWKAIRVVGLAVHGAHEELDALPPAVGQEIQAWRNAQRGCTLKVRRTSEAFQLSQFGGFAVLLQKSIEAPRANIDQIPDRIRARLPTRRSRQLDGSSYMLPQGFRT